jgi:hypothetical protein
MSGLRAAVSRRSSIALPLAACEARYRVEKTAPPLSTSPMTVRTMSPVIVG